MSELQELKDEIKELRGDMRANTQITTDGFNIVNGRIKKLELKEAKREGIESVTGHKPVNWGKLLGTALGVAAAAIALAVTIINSSIGSANI